MTPDAAVSDAAALPPTVDAGADDGAADRAATDAEQPSDGPSVDGPPATGDAAPTSVPCTETTACASPAVLPAIQGGLASGPNSLTATSGIAAGWYEVEVDQNPLATGSAIRVQVVPDSPGGSDFDIDVYSSSESAQRTAQCATVTASSHNGPGQVDSVSFSWATNTGFPEVRVLLVHVTAKLGTACATDAKWQLGIYSS